MRLGWKQCQRSSGWSWGCKIEVGRLLGLVGIDLGDGVGACKDDVETV